MRRDSQMESFVRRILARRRESMRTCTVRVLNDDDNDQRPTSTTSMMETQPRHSRSRQVSLVRCTDRWRRMGEFKGTREAIGRCEEQRGNEKKKDRTSERKEVADRACAATVELRSQVLVHGRNGRVDRFPSIRVLPTTLTVRSASTEWGTVRRGGKNGRGERGEPCTACCAMPSVREGSRGSSLPFSSLFPLLSFLFSLTRGFYQV